LFTAPPGQPGDVGVEVTTDDRERAVGVPDGGAGAGEVALEAHVRHRQRPRAGVADRAALAAAGRSSLQRQVRHREPARAEDVEDAIGAEAVDDRLVAAGARDAERVEHVEVAGDPEVLFVPGRKETEGARGQHHASGPGSALASITAARSVQPPVAVAQAPSPGTASTTSVVESTVNVAAPAGSVVARRNPNAAIPRGTRTIRIVGTDAQGL
jgi:hypothetical protein